MRIVVADDLPKTALDLLTAEGWTVDARSGRTPEQLIADLAEADALVVRSATKVPRSCGPSPAPAPAWTT
jgi:phosphoglycerate dehydrogenase-like enzyme